MNTLKIEEKLAKKFGYNPLSGDLSTKYRKFFEDNIPGGLSINGSADELYTLNGSLICNGYDRIVIGDYGAFIEFSKPPDNFIIAPGQEYRIQDKQYSRNVKYIWLTIDDGSNVKIYYQKRTVTYADYRPKKFYVSVHEVALNNKPN